MRHIKNILNSRLGGLILKKNPYLNIKQFHSHFLLESWNESS